KVSAPASTASRHNSSTSSSGYVTLPRCRGSGKSLKYSKKTTASSNPSEPAPNPSIAIPQNQPRGSPEIQHSSSLSRTSFTRLPCRLRAATLRIHPETNILLLSYLDETMSAKRKLTTTV